MAVVDDSCLKQAHSLFLGLRVGGRLAMLYIHQMNRVNSRNDLVVMMKGLQISSLDYYYYYYAVSCTVSQHVTIAINQPI